MRGGAAPRMLLAWCAVAATAGLVSAPPAAARARKPAEPPRGWVVDRARFEPLDGGLVSVAGTGDVRGALEVVPAGGSVAVVNELSLDDYLRGVAEVPATWPLEALRAQAIAARTFALYAMAADAATAAKGVGAHICATQACQVYIGMARERQEHGERWVQAVQSTAGQVLLYRGEPILAMYSSSNGGRSMPGGRPYLRAVNDPDSARGPYGHWTVRFAYGELGSALGVAGTVTAVHREGDGVVLDWTGAAGAGGRTVVPVAAFRDRLNQTLPPQGDLPTTVPSTQFTVAGDDQGRVATLDGRGHGHGIGMSQFGALGRAGRGQRAADILAAYYGGLRPVSVPADSMPASIRVALDTAGGATTVGGTGRFRVLDGSGAPVAVAASGSWRVVAAGRGRVRVVPPRDQEAAPAVDALAVRPPSAAHRGEVRVHLATAAQVRVRVEGAALPAPVESPATVVGPGDVVVPLPAVPGPGRFAVTLLADAGAGRVTAGVVPLVVRSLVPAPGARPLAAGGAPAVPRPVAVAAGLLVAVAAGVARSRDVLRATPGLGGRRPR